MLSSYVMPHVPRTSGAADVDPAAHPSPWAPIIRGSAATTGNARKLLIRMSVDSSNVGPIVPPASRALADVGLPRSAPCPVVHEVFRDADRVREQRFASATGHPRKGSDPFHARYS